MLKDSDLLEKNIDAEKNQRKFRIHGKACIMQTTPSYSKVLMPVQYTVSMNFPETHYFNVEMIIPGTTSSRERLRVVMPVWTPGSYLVREFARNVLEFKAHYADTDSEIGSYKDSKNSWVVESSSGRSVRITYRVYAFEYTVDTSYLDNRHGIINGASVFMFAEGYENEPVLLTVIPSHEWKVVSTSLDHNEGTNETNSWSFRAPNFDIMVDSPIEIGNQEVRSFVVEGITHDVSMFGPKPIDAQSFVSDLKGIVESTWTIFGVIPYSRYVFLVDFAGFNLGGKGGGLEHLSSTHCIIPRLRLMPRQEYARSMGLFSHEFFHAWNVKRMRPRGLGPFDYSSETYTKSLWIAEGITSYYDDLILRRCGIYSTAEYMDAFCVNIDQLSSLPGPKYESAEESSFDTWIKHYHPNENSPNTHSSYYFQGAVIAWMIDMEIRKSTKNERSLDDAMRKLYNESFVKEHRGYTDGEFERICNEMCSKNLSAEIFDKRVRGHEGVDFGSYLGYAGLRLGPRNKSTSGKGYLGIKVKTEAGKILIASKLFSTPADKAGLAAGDEIIAVDNLRMDFMTLPFYIGNREPGDSASILIARDGYLETREACLVEMPQIETRIYKKGTATEEEKTLYSHWMLEEWDLPLEYSEYVPSPQRPKLLDYF